ncbi:MAG: endonuclease Q family protein [Candidatus Nanoarchaeia archaeon]|nr:endonuclease Q family protein [Candidatus Nanoarchaeia archaeon]MDD5588030.1 endonuclease Q family protein [Candidatus Nanoarchaeia archaeon]
MKIFADLHLHTKYSRATSINMNIDFLEKYAKIKGLNLLGTGDFTHPKWFAELKEKLKQDEIGILKSKSGMNFILQGEISLIYTQGKGRRVHVILLAPNFEIAEQITEYLKTKGRVDYDGRPIFKIPLPELTEKLMSISKEIMIIPAHCMTPWFGILGSESGFDSIQEAFQDQVKNIYALETGLSADPAMLWRLSSLDKFAFISNSDSHSYWPWRLGRETNVFDFNKLTYKDFINAIKEKDSKKFLYTIEVDPAFGKYHYDGHRACNINYSPSETKKHKGICPICKKGLTIGVESRIEQLADREMGFKPKAVIPFKSVIPLSEVIASCLNVQASSKKVMTEFNNLINKFENEFNILLDVPEQELEKVCSKDIAKMILLNREGKLKIIPGYDGVYGQLLKPGEVVEKKFVKNIQKSLDEY